MNQWQSTPRGKARRNSSLNSSPNSSPNSSLGGSARRKPQTTRGAQAVMMVCMVMAASGAGAQTSDGTSTNVTANATTRDPGSLPTTTVSARKDTGADNQGLVATRATGATKSDTPLIETPQSVSVVTQDQLAAQGATSVAEALRYTSSVTSEIRGNSSNGAPYLYSRGFFLEQFLDGTRLPSDTSFAYAIPNFDPYGMDRIEVLHGPASVLYGQANPGGVANLVSKQPVTTPVHEVFVQTGSHGRAEAGFDLGGALNDDGSLSYRLTGLGLDTGTQVNNLNQKRVYIAPSITWRPDADTSLTAFAKFQRDPDVGNYNFVPAKGSVLAGPEGAISPGTDQGNPKYDSHSRTQFSVGYRVEHNINSTWTLRQNLSYNSVKDDLKQQFTYGWNTGTLLNVYPFENHETAKIFSLDNQAQARFATGDFKHKVLFGADYQHVSYSSSTNFGAFTTQDAYNPVYADVVAPAVSSSSLVQQKQIGLYAQDQVGWHNWRALVGVREDWANADNTDQLANTTSHQSQRAFTWRSGLVYLFDNGLAPYASYARSFTPQVQTLADGSAAKPSTAQQYELGLKYQPKGYDSFITGALFDLRKQNVTGMDPATFTYFQTGEIRSRGVELEGKAVLSEAFNVTASYTYLSSVNLSSIESATNIDGTSTTQQGKQTWGIPRHSAALWGDYTFRRGQLRGFGFGAGARYVGQSRDISNSVTVPSATLLDAAIHYDTGEHWLLTLNAKNLLNRQYVSSCYSASICTYADGAQVLATARYRW